MSFHLKGKNIMDKYILNQMKDDLKKKHREKDKLLNYYVKARLDKSFKNYYDHVEYYTDLLSRYSDVRMMKRLNKVGKKK